MNLSDIARELNLEHLTPELVNGGLPEVTRGYASDLLSDVLAHAPQGGLLVTVQVHINVVAVAVHANLKAVVFASDRRPDESVRAQAVKEDIHLYVAGASAFDVAGRLYALGLRGPTE